MKVTSEAPEKTMRIRLEDTPEGVRVVAEMDGTRQDLVLISAVADGLAMTKLGLSADRAKAMGIVQDQSDGCIATYSRSLP